jgi:hypothetical protein
MDLLQAQLFRKDETLLERDRSISRLQLSDNADATSLQAEVSRLNQVCSATADMMCILRVCLLDCYIISF